MSAPKSALSTLRPDLSGSLMEFDLLANMNGFVGLEIFPVIEVASQMGNWGRVPIEELLKSADDTRAPGSGYKRTSGRFEPDTYVTAEHGIEEAVDDREASMYANYFDAELLAAMRARHTVLQNFEARCIALAATANSTGVSTPWSTVASCTPIDDVTTGLDTIYARAGKIANCLVISWRRFNVLKNCAQIIDRVKYTGLYDTARGGVTAQAIAQVLGIEELRVAGSVKNTANEGAAAAAGTATLASLWTDTTAFLYVKPKTNDPREACFGRTFHWGEDGSAIGGVVESYRSEKDRSDIVRVRMDEVEKIVFTECGQLLTSI